MGLDMYLKRGKKIPKISWEEYKEIRNKVAIDDEEVLEKYKDYVVNCGEYYKWNDLVKEVGYWRKANQVHKWMVDKVQNGVDDCDLYEVKKEDLERLLWICESIVENCKLIEGKVVNGYTFENGMKVPIIEDGKVMTNIDVAKNLLPTSSGFFFGGTDYDEYYMSDITNTIEIIKRVLKETNFDEEYIAYESSW